MWESAQSFLNFYLIIVRTTFIDIVTNFNLYVQSYPSSFVQNLADYKTVFIQLWTNAWKLANSKAGLGDIVRALEEIIVGFFTSEFMLDFSSIAFLVIILLLIAINHSSASDYTLVDKFITLTENSNTISNPKVEILSTPKKSNSVRSRTPMKSTDPAEAIINNTQVAVYTTSCLIEVIFFNFHCPYVKYVVSSASE